MRSFLPSTARDGHRRRVVERAIDMQVRLSAEINRSIDCRPRGCKFDRRHWAQSDLRQQCGRHAEDLFCRPLYPIDREMAAFRSGVVEDVLKRVVVRIHSAGEVRMLSSSKSAKLLSVVMFFGRHNAMSLGNCRLTLEKDSCSPKRSGARISHEGACS